MDVRGTAAKEGEAVPSGLSERLAQERVAVSGVEAGERVEGVHRMVETEMGDAHATRAGSDSGSGT